MKEKDKTFKRGMGFTFTPSRVSDDGEIDFIDELNELLAASGLSQNKFMEMMLREAVDYQKLKKAGLIDSFLNNEKHPQVSDSNQVLEPIEIKPTVTTSFKSFSEANQSQSTSEAAPSELNSEPVLIEQNNDNDLNEAKVSNSMSEVQRRALERAKKTKLKS